MTGLNQFDAPRILELCCGDGFFPANVYLNVEGADYVGCDLQESSIEYARKRLRARINDVKSTGRFIVADILEDMPCKDEDLTNVFWFSAIYMFTEEQQRKILGEVAARLKQRKGILSGSALLSEVRKDKHWDYWIRLFDDEEELRALLKNYFENVYIGKTSTKYSLFFMASDGKLPYHN
ncbi:MAG: class I SAM-dependent methyltransferase [Eubacterium sp.]|nr:class I SAM-dependent methyltransferase [Eubacterium sp.]MCM1342924.1 class I SAM-dependent methyltransferase [Muribaculaceae bacterium]MCM1411370.1 class I SAM-dependent methyltransferase [Lachnospiraceae bacterium]